MDSDMNECRRLVHRTGATTEEDWQETNTAWQGVCELRLPERRLEDRGGFVKVGAMLGLPIGLRTRVPMCACQGWDRTVHCERVDLPLSGTRGYNRTYHSTADLLLVPEWRLATDDGHLPQSGQ